MVVTVEEATGTNDVEVVLVVEAGLAAVRTLLAGAEKLLANGFAAGAGAGAAVGAGFVKAEKLANGLLGVKAGAEVGPPLPVNPENAANGLLLALFGAAAATAAATAAAADSLPPIERLSLQPDKEVMSSSIYKRRGDISYLTLKILRLFISWSEALANAPYSSGSSSEPSLLSASSYDK